MNTRPVLFAALVVFTPAKPGPELRGVNVAPRAPSM